MNVCKCQMIWIPFRLTSFWRVTISPIVPTKINTYVSMNDNQGTAKTSHHWTWWALSRKKFSLGALHRLDFLSKHQKWRQGQYRTEFYQSLHQRLEDPTEWETRITLFHSHIWTGRQIQGRSMWELSFILSHVKSTWDWNIQAPDMNP